MSNALERYRAARQAAAAAAAAASEAASEQRAGSLARYKAARPTALRIQRQTARALPPPRPVRSYPEAIAYAERLESLTAGLQAHRPTPSLNGPDLRDHRPWTASEERAARMAALEAAARPPRRQPVGPACACQRCADIRSRTPR